MKKTIAELRTQSAITELKSTQSIGGQTIQTLGPEEKPESTNIVWPGWGTLLTDTPKGNETGIIFWPGLGTM